MVKQMREKKITGWIDSHWDIAYSLGKWISNRTYWFPDIYKTKEACLAHNDPRLGYGKPVQVEVIIRRKE